MARAIIHGTDWWTDCDDVAALRILCRAHKAGLIDLKGVGINSVMEYSALSVSAFMTAEDVDVPIGLDRNAVRNGERCRYQKTLAEYPHGIQSDANCPEAWKMYRRILAEADGKVDITEVGFPQIIMQLMRSGPDGYSPLDGLELVRNKVGRIWLMAGKWDEPAGREYNLTAYPECCEAGHYICEHSPVPLVFLGFEVGCDVITGRDMPEGDLLGEAFKANGAGNGRSSWDPMLVLAAITGDFEKAGYKAVNGKAFVDEETGANSFIPGEGSHAYLVKTRPDGYYGEQINRIIRFGF